MFCSTTPAPLSLFIGGADSGRRRFAVGHKMLTVSLLLISTLSALTQARVAFEKMTDLDYVGDTYYTIRNLSLYECQGWCREEPECQAASFSFAVNPLSATGKQETECLLQNATQANNPAAKPAKALSQYYMVKMSVRSDRVCKRPWNFERVPNSMIEGHDKALIFTSTKEACLAACLNEKNFVCRSAEYNYVTLQCRLSDYDRRTLKDGFRVGELVSVQGVDYFENLCLQSASACPSPRSYQAPRVGISPNKVALHVGIHFYVDKELMANSQQACGRACQIESEFLCRSYLYLGPPTGADYNCKLYHMDHYSLPTGAEAFSTSNAQYIDGGRIGTFYENRCENSYHPYHLPTGPSEPRSLSSLTDMMALASKRPKAFTQALDEDDGKDGLNGGLDTMLCKRVVTKDRRYITQITCFEKGQQHTFGAKAASPATSARSKGKTRNNGNVPTTNGMPAAGTERNALRLPVFGKQQGGGALASLFSLNRQLGATGSGPPSRPNRPANGTPKPPRGDGGAQGGRPNNPGPALPQFGGGDGPDSSLNDIDESDVNCDNTGTCYDVTVHCKDTKIVVNVGTNRPFSGRVYALGRSETCNVDVINSNSFRLDLTMGGQDCNTQTVSGVYTNTVVVQRHSVVMTKTDKIYKVRCTYDTSSKNITFGMMPIRDPDMISITSAPEAPAPRISILNSRGSEVETVRIGDQLTFKIEIPDKTPYGIFARSCVAMAKDSRSTFPIIDDEGCPVDPTIFPRFTPEGNALVSSYEAFRFTESYGVIFQCNVKYCLGPCPPTSCNFGRESFDSWGRRKRRAVSDDDDDLMRLSREIIVLDYGDEQTSPYDFDKPLSRPRDGNLTDYHATPYDWEQARVNEAPFGYRSTHSASGGNDDDYLSHLLGAGAGAEDMCPTRTSVLGLAVTCALLVVLYVCTVFCVCIRRTATARGNKKATPVIAREYLR